MCRPDSIKAPSAEQNRGLFLFSVESFSGKNGAPNAMAQLCTGTIIVLFLVALEMALQQFFISIKVWE
jgi:hypothetical protein